MYISSGSTSGAALVVLNFVINKWKWYVQNLTYIKAIGLT